MNGADKKLPCGWSVVPLKEIADTSSGGTPFRKESAYYGGDIAWVKSGELGDGIVTKVEESITEAGLQASSAKIFPKGTLCIALYGATVGKLGILGSEAATNQAVCGIFLHPDIATEFAFHFLKHQRADLIAQGKGGAQPNISQEIVRDTEIILAPAAEQRRIVAKIEALQERSRKARAALEAIPPLLEQFRQSVLAAAFRGDLTADWRAQHPDVEPASVLLDRIRADRRRRWEEAELSKMQAKGKMPKDEKWKERYKEPEQVDESVLPGLPKGWGWARLADLCQVQGGYAFKSTSYVSDGVPLIRISDLISGEVPIRKEIVKLPHSFIADYREYQLNFQDILIALSGATTGKMAVFSSSTAALLNQRVGRFVPHSKNNLAGGYLRLLIESLSQNIRSRAYGGAQPNISPSEIELTIVPLAPKAEQDIIEKKVAHMWNSSQALGRDMDTFIEQIDILDQSILAKAFRGELVPQDPNDEPASVLLDRIRAEREAQSSKPRAKKKTPGSTKHTKKAPPVSVNENDDLPLFNNLQK